MPHKRNSIHERVSRGADLNPASTGRVTTAIVAAMIVAIGVLVSTAALVMLEKLVLLMIHAARSVESGRFTSQITWDDATRIAAVIVFVATYLVVAIGKLPGYQLDRAGAALVGASLMVGVGVVSLDQAYRAIDFDAITLLLGMMIVVANLRLSGFFRLVSNFIVAYLRSR